MNMRRLLFGALVLMQVLSAGCISMDEPGQAAESSALRRELSVDDLQGVRTSFTPALSGKYAVTLDFPQPIDDDQARDLVNRAAGGIGIDSAPVRFDFEWRVLDAGRLIARGTGRKGATGTIDTVSSGLGGGPLKSRALAFGEFRAEAGRHYTIELNVGSEFASLLRGKPQLEVMFDSTSRR
jgi:hypothetical protein